MTGPREARPATVTSPADLLLRVTPTETGLRFTSPQLPGWGTTARGALPVASAVDTAMRELAVASYARRRGERRDVEMWDAAAELLAEAGEPLSPDEVIVLRDTPRSSAQIRPGRNGFDPWAWQPLTNGQWLSPGGSVYDESTRCVQRVIARRQAEPRLGDDGEPQQGRLRLVGVGGR